MEAIKNSILELLEKDSRVSLEDMSAMLGSSTDEIAAAMDEMKRDKIICGYTALVNWDKTDRQFVTAMIEVKVTPQRDRGFEKIAERIYGFDEVKAVYLMAGAYDLLVMMDGKNIRDISYFISNKLSPIDNVLSTATHFVLKKYKDHGVVFEKGNDEDERMIVTP
jgi:DNA-binding Lrp family transcriptional regulator